VLYKVVAKIISRKINIFLSYSVSNEQFRFLEGPQIHEAIGVTRKGMHTLKINKAKGVVLKIDLSKAYDRVNWSYMQLLPTHLGFEVRFI